MKGLEGSFLERFLEGGVEHEKPVVKLTVLPAGKGCKPWNNLDDSMILEHAGIACEAANLRGSESRLGGTSVLSILVWFSSSGMQQRGFETLRGSTCNLQRSL